MRIARVRVDDVVAFALVGNETFLEIDKHPFGDIQLTGREFPIEKVKLLAPILPSKVVAVGKNYRDHAAEMASDVPAEPLLFLKPNTSVVGPGDPVMRPPQSSRVDYEAELAVVIGRLCRSVKAAQAGEMILGYTAANDITARDLQASDGQWTRAKGFDTFCPLGPWIENEIDLTSENRDVLPVECIVNGEVKQSGDTSQMVFDVPTLIEYISSVMTLLPGDVILTGTPSGIGPLSAGDEVDVKIGKIGALRNAVIDRPS